MNWDDARVFLAVEREKTLRGAARTLNLDQATVGRRIAALEHALGATLFLRTSEGYALTAAGEAALKSAEKMEHSAHELVRRTQGTDTRLAGDVRVTSTDSIALEFLLPAIERLHAAHPEVRVLLDTSTRMLNLAKREADIAVRSVRPDIAVAHDLRPLRDVLRQELGKGFRGRSQRLRAEAGHLLANVGHLHDRRDFAVEAFNGRSRRARGREYPVP